MDERKAIVAWLREHAAKWEESSKIKVTPVADLHAEMSAKIGTTIADAIERGDHLPPPPLAVSDDKESSHE